MSLETYKILHVFGVLLLVAALGGVALHAANGGRRESATRRLVAILHGVALLVIPVAGFGMLARLGLVRDLPGWAWAKLVLWLVLGAVLYLPYRRPTLARSALIAVPLLGALGAYLAITKPF